MNPSSRLLFLILTALVLTPPAFAREFINATYELQLVYSHFDSGTVPAGKIQGTIRRTNDHIACLLQVNGQSYDCKTSRAVDSLVWLNLELDAYLKTALDSIDTKLPRATQERIRQLLNAKLVKPMLITGAGYSFRNQVQLYEEDAPDVLRLLVKIN